MEDLLDLCGQFGRDFVLRKCRLQQAENVVGEGYVIALERVVNQAHPLRHSRLAEGRIAASTAHPHEQALEFLERYLRLLGH